MQGLQQTTIKFVLFYILSGFGTEGWYRAAVCQQLLLQCQAAYLGEPALQKFENGDYESSLHDFYRLLWLAPNATYVELYTDILRFYLITFTNPTEPLSMTMGLDQMDTVIYNNRGNVRLEQDDPAGAIADYTEAIQLQPDLAAPYYNRGNAYLAVGDRAAAQADLQQAVDCWRAGEMIKWYKSTLAELNRLTDDISG